MGNYAVEVVTVPSRQLAVRHGHTDRAGLAAFLASAFEDVAASLTAAGVEVLGPAVASYRPTGDGFDVAAGFPCDTAAGVGGDVVLYALPAAEVVTTLHIGPYDLIPLAYDALAEHARLLGRSLDPTAPMWEDYRSGPGVAPAAAQTVVFAPLLPRSAEAR